MARRLPAAIAVLGALAAAPSAHASLFSGDTLDAVANVLAWIVLIIAPAIAIAVFWMVHILPEKIAERRRHPQASAIKTLCLLSLFFGGMLWPLAWLWAYSKPVLYKLAYGTDVADPHEHSSSVPTAEPSSADAPLPARPAEEV
jgi:CBS domain containing-hemolysin-like protein